MATTHAIVVPKSLSRPPLTFEQKLYEQILQFLVSQLSSFVQHLPAWNQKTWPIIVEVTFKHMMTRSEERIPVTTQIAGDESSLPQHSDIRALMRYVKRKHPPLATSGGQIPFLHVFRFYWVDVQLSLSMSINLLDLVHNVNIESVKLEYEAKSEMPSVDAVHKALSKLLTDRPTFVKQFLLKYVALGHYQCQGQTSTGRVSAFRTIIHKESLAYISDIHRVRKLHPELTDVSSILTRICTSVTRDKTIYDFFICTTKQQYSPTEPGPTGQRNSTAGPNSEHRVVGFVVGYRDRTSFVIWHAFVEPSPDQKQFVNALATSVKIFRHDYDLTECVWQRTTGQSAIYSAWIKQFGFQFLTLMPSFDLSESGSGSGSGDGDGALGQLVKSELD